MREIKERKVVTVPQSHPGNTHALKATTPELRQKVFKSYCEHIAKGKSSRSWYYKDETGLALSGKTIERYMQEYPADCPAEQKDVAMAQSLGVWEEVLESSAKGTNKDANVAALQMLMRNKFGWDKRDNVISIDSVEVNIAHEKLLSQLDAMQQARTIDIHSEERIEYNSPMSEDKSE